MLLQASLGACTHPAVPGCAYEPLPLSLFDHHSSSSPPQQQTQPNMRRQKLFGGAVRRARYRSSESRKRGPGSGLFKGAVTRIVVMVFIVGVCCRCRC